MFCRTAVIFLCAQCIFSGSLVAQEPGKSSQPAINSSPGEVGQHARTKLFGLEAEGTKFVYVFDRSQSMGEEHGARLQAAKDELLASLADLGEQNQFYVVFYNHEPRLFEPGPATGRLVFATPDNKKRAEQFVAGMRADGATNHVAALLVALRLRPDVIFLLTDGDAKDDPTADDLKRIERINGGGASINVIQFAPEPRPTSTLVQLANQNRGQHVFVDLNRLHSQGTPSQ